VGRGARRGSQIERRTVFERRDGQTGEPPARTATSLRIGSTTGRLPRGRHREGESSQIRSAPRRCARVIGTVGRPLPDPQVLAHVAAGAARAPGSFSRAAARYAIDDLLAMLDVAARHDLIQLAALCERELVARLRRGAARRNAMQCGGGGGGAGREDGAEGGDDSGGAHDGDGGGAAATPADALVVLRGALASRSPWLATRAFAHVVGGAAAVVGDDDRHAARAGAAAAAVVAVGAGAGGGVDGLLAGSGALVEARDLAAVVATLEEFVLALLTGVKRPRPTGDG